MEQLFIPDEPEIIVTLSRSEVYIAKYLGKQRYLENRRNNIENTKIGGQDDSYIDAQGVGAELAFCKYFNLYPDLVIHYGKTKRPAFDVLINGLTWDVKTTAYPKGKLLAPIKKNLKRCDRYALVIGELPEFQIFGWASDEELFQERNIGDMGHGPTYVLAQEKLHRFKEEHKERVRS